MMPLFWQWTVKVEGPTPPPKKKNPKNNPIYSVLLPELFSWCHHEGIYVENLHAFLVLYYFYFFKCSVLTLCVLLCLYS